MIEKKVLDYLDSELDVPVWMEIPEGESLPDRYILLEKTGSSTGDHIRTSTIAIQSYGESLVAAAVLNEQVKKAMDGLISLEAVCRSRLNSDYNFTDTTKKKYRYQAVYDITHYC